jgi:hypothetical protein
MFDEFAPKPVCEAREAVYFMKWAFGLMIRCLRPVLFEGGRSGHLSDSFGVVGGGVELALGINRMANSESLETVFHTHGGHPGDHPVILWWKALGAVARAMQLEAAGQSRVGAPP